MSKLERCPRRKQQVLTQQGADTLFLLNMEDGQYFALEDVGARVWHLCDGSRNVSQIASDISEEYKIDLDTVEADLLELLSDLAKAELIDGFE